MTIDHLQFDPSDLDFAITRILLVNFVERIFIDFSEKVWTELLFLEMYLCTHAVGL